MEKGREKGAGIWDSGGPDRKVDEMSKAMMLGLALLAAFVIVLIMTGGNVTVNLFSMKVTLKTSYALLAAAGVGVVAGALLRK